MARDRPALGLLVDRRPEAAAIDLVAALARWVRPVALPPLASGECPTAVFATSVVAAAQAGGRGPLAVWVTEDDLLDEQMAEGAVLVGPAAPDVHPHVRVPRGSVDLSPWVWFPPFVRARQRRRLGLPDVALDVRADAPSPIPRRDVPTALVLAPAAVVDEEWLLPALALGTPCAATDAVAAGVLPAAGHDAVVAGAADDLEDIASSLAAEPDQARRSRAARSLAQTYDLAHAARRVTRALAIDESGRGDHLDSRLAELRTPATSFVRRRAIAAVGVLPRNGPEATR